MLLCQATKVFACVTRTGQVLLALILVVLLSVTCVVLALKANVCAILVTLVPVAIPCVPKDVLAMVNVSMVHAHASQVLVDLIVLLRRSVPAMIPREVLVMAMVCATHLLEYVTVLLGFLEAIVPRNLLVTAVVASILKVLVVFVSMVVVGVILASKVIIAKLSRLVKILVLDKVYAHEANAFVILVLLVIHANSLRWISRVPTIVPAMVCVNLVDASVLLVSLVLIAVWLPMKNNVYSLLTQKPSVKVVVCASMPNVIVSRDSLDLTVI